MASDGLARRLLPWVIGWAMLTTISTFWLIGRDAAQRVGLGTRYDTGFEAALHVLESRGGEAHSGMSAVAIIAARVEAAAAVMRRYPGGLLDQHCRMALRRIHEATKP